ncbi:hypothetical protein TNCV_4339651 [Trichonephila clavipes]|nr:hypothetical protein TNCV_4339651 [Trichonephila clavipes]
MTQLLEDFDFIEKLTSKPPSLKISFFRSNALVMESLLYDESTPNNINCGLRRTGLDIEKLAKSALLESSWLSFAYILVGGQTDCNSTIFDIFNSGYSKG